MTRTLALPVLALVAACCGGSGGRGGSLGPAGGIGDAPGGAPNDPGGGTAPISVSSASTPLTPQSVLGAVATNAACTRNGVGAYHSAIRIVATSWAATCEGFRDNKANSTTLDVLVRRTRADGTAPDPIAPGQYQTGRTGDVTAEIRVVKKDGRCGPGADPVASQGMAVAGTVTVTRVSPTLEGAVNATLSNGARVTGTFSAEPCAMTAGDACDVATLDPTSLGVCVQ